MAAARDKLIAEWHERLAAAEAADTSSLSRPAWLARLQIRLYRFLLSLYGDGDWTTTPPRRTNSPPNAEGGGDSVVFDSPTALPLAGKPPKSLGQIQAVLKSVANAQAAAPAAGPLVHGLTPEHWVTVALASARHAHKALRVVEAIHASGIEVRHYAQGPRHVVEVRAGDFEEALRIARQPPPPLRPGPVRVVTTRSKPGPLAKYLPHAIVIGVAVGATLAHLAAVWADALQLVNTPSNRSLLFSEALMWLTFFGGWFLGAVAIVACFRIFDLALSALRDRLGVRQDRRGSLTRFFSGLGWQCFAAGVLIGPFIGLFAVGLAGKAAEGHEAVFFLGGWIMSMLAGAALYIEREV